MINGGDILLIYTKMLLLLLLINICYSNYTLLRDCYVDFSPSSINSYNLILLEDEMVDPSDNDNFAIACASGGELKEVVSLLLEGKRVDPSDNDNYTIENGHIEIGKMLLKDKRVAQIHNK